MGRSRRSANQRYHDRVAGRYAGIYDNAYWHWHDGLTWDYLKPHLPTDINAPVLDLGCGAGKWGCKLLKSGYRVTFVDLSIKMLDEAAKQVAQMGAESKAEFIQADAGDLHALPDAHFGLVTAMGEPIGLTDSPQRVLREVARCLLSGGVLVATFDNRVACIDHFVKEGDVQALEAFLSSGRTHWLTRDESEQFPIHTFEPPQLTRMLAAAGFEVLEITGKTVLPMRYYRQLLEEPEARRRWARIERRLARDPANLARCAHLQVAARRVAP